MARDMDRRSDDNFEDDFILMGALMAMMDDDDNDDDWDYDSDDDSDRGWGLEWNEEEGEWAYTEEDGEDAPHDEEDDDIDWSFLLDDDEVTIPDFSWEKEDPLELEDLLGDKREDWM